MLRGLTAEQNSKGFEMCQRSPDPLQQGKRNIFEQKSHETKRGLSLWNKLQKAIWSSNSKDEIQISIIGIRGSEMSYTGRLYEKGVYDQHCMIQYFAGQKF